MKPTNVTGEEYVASRFREANRKWCLVGMILGTALGLVPILIPGIVGHVLLCTSLGAFLGTALILMKLNAAFGKWGPSRSLKLIAAATSLGGIGGLVYALAVPGGLQGEHREMACVASATCGFLAGYALVEFLLRRKDRQSKDQLMAEYRITRRSSWKTDVPY